MAIDWTLAHEVFGGAVTEKSLADWGISNPRLTFTNQGRDTLTFDINRLVDAADLFDLGDNGLGHRLLLKKSVDGGTATPVFIGTITKVPRRGTPRDESHQFTVEGPWYMLEELMLEQEWKSWNGAAMVNEYISTITLGLTIDGDALDSAEQIEAVLEYAKTAVFDSTGSGFKLQYDVTGFPDVEFPWETIQDTTCAEAIRKVLRWTPDAITWWDYSTKEGGDWSPTFRCKRRSALTSRTLAIGSPGSPIKNFNVSPRRDIHRPGVVLRFAVNTEVNGSAFRSIVTQKYPIDVDEIGVRLFKATIEMQGLSMQQSYLQCATVSESDINWWKTKLPWLSDPGVTATTVTSATRQSALPREIVQGQVADWMYVSGAPIQTAQETITAKILVSDGNGVRQENVSTQIVATNATTGNYTSVQAIGQPIPAGLAQHFYNDVNMLHWQGECTTVEQEWTAAVKLGDVLNFSGGHDDWVSMNALVFEVSVDLARGESVISYGPSENLGPRDLIDLARANRNRIPLVSVGTRVNGISPSIQLGRTLPKQDSASAVNQVREFKMSDPDANSSVNMVVTDIPASLEAKFRAYSICVDGVTKTVYLLGTEPVTP